MDSKWYFIYLKKLKSCKSAPSIQKQLTALYRTSYGHAHLLKFKVHFKGYFKCGNRVQLRHRNTAAKTAIGMSAGDME